MASPEPQRGRRRTSPRGLLQLAPRFRLPAQDLALVEHEAQTRGLPTSQFLREIVEAHVASDPAPPQDAIAAVRADATLDDHSKDLLATLINLLRERARFID